MSPRPFPQAAVAVRSAFAGRVLIAAALAVALAAALVAVAAAAAPRANAGALSRFGDTIFTVGATGDPNADNRRDFVLRLTGKEPVAVPYPAAVVGMGDSVSEGVANLTAALEASEGPVTVVALSQGAVVGGNVAHQRDTAEHALLENYILMGSPDFQHGVSDRLPFGSIPLIGLPLEGSRGTQFVQVDMICSAGDVLCDPAGSPVNYLPSFLFVHMGLAGGDNYNNLDEREVVWTSEDGETTYYVYAGQHPLSYGYSLLSGRAPSDQLNAGLEVIAPTSRTVGVGGPVTLFDPQSVTNFVDTLRPSTPAAPEAEDVLVEAETVTPEVPAIETPSPELIADTSPEPVQETAPAAVEEVPVQQIAPEPVVETAPAQEAAPEVVVEAAPVIEPAVVETVESVDAPQAEYDLAAE